MMMLVLGGLRWDSEKGNPTHATHSYLTEWAIDQLKGQRPEFEQYRKQIIEGANQEMHELKTSGSLYGVDLDAERQQHKGTNEGCDDIKGWWDDARNAYRAGDEKKAYFLLGIMLHMVQDMGVPAHANHVPHQGNLTQFDNFEFMALMNWKPKFDDINRTDPGFAEPWEYYGESQKWTHADAPDYNNRNKFSKTWAFASAKERALLSNRQGRTCHITMWALKSAAKALAETAKGGDTTAGPKPAQVPASADKRIFRLVMKGDTLWGIAKTYYGDGRMWSRIYEANRAVIGVNPNKIYPGQKLEIP